MELEWNRKAGSNVLENVIAVVAEVSAGCIMLDLPISPPDGHLLSRGDSTVVCNCLLSKICIRLTTNQKINRDGVYIYIIIVYYSKTRMSKHRTICARTKAAAAYYLGYRIPHLLRLVRIPS